MADTNTAADDTWDLPDPVTDPADALRVKPYTPQPDAKPAQPATATATAGLLGVTPQPANSNARTLAVPAAAAQPAVRPATPPPTPPLVAPLQGDPNEHRMVPWERARLMIMGPESGGQNVWNYRHAERPDYFTAGGKFQIVDSTWRQGAQWAGIDVSAWPHAIMAPDDVQDKVAHAIYDHLGFAPWSKAAGGALPNQPGQPDTATRLGIEGQQTPYDPTASITEMRRIEQERIAMERPLIESRLRKQQAEEADADEAYGNFKRDLNDPALKPWTQKPPAPDPIGGLASLGSVFAALASGFSHTPGIAAMNGMAAAIDARNEGNQKQYDDAFKAYQYNADLALRRQEIVQAAYDRAWARVKENPALGLAELKAVSQVYDDEKSEVLFEQGQLEKAYELNASRIENANKLRIELDKLDQISKFGFPTGSPDRQQVDLRAKQLMGPPWYMSPVDAITQANAEVSAAKQATKPKTAAQTADAEAGVLAVEQWKQDHGGVEPTEVEKQSAEFIRDKRAARAKTPNLNPKEQDVNILARAAFAAKHGHAPTNSDADAQEMAQLRVEQRQAAQGVVDDATADLIAGEVLSGNKDATVGLARNSANIAKVGRSLVKLANEQGVTPGMLSVRFAEFTGLMQAERTLGARTANMEVPANEVNFMGDLALKASEKVSRTDYPNINDAIIAWQRGTGDTDVVDFGQATYSLVISYAKFLNPTGVPTDADKANATNILQMGWSHDQFREAIAFMKKEIASGQQGVAATRFELPNIMLPSARGTKEPTPGGTPAPGTTSAPAAGGTAPQVSEKEYEALPSGAPYRTLTDPNTIRVKP